MSNSIEKAQQRLNKGDQVKEDMALMLAPHANLIQQITPAPITVAVLAELALLSTAHTDFKLEEPKGGFKRLQWNMFKPSLMQVSHEGWHAFNKAHSGMNEIRQQTDRIPGDMKEVLNILLNMQDEDVAALLPISLKSLEDVADSCLARSKEVEEKFNSVGELMDELLQSSLSTESTSKHKKESLEFSRIQKEKEEDFLKTQKEEFKRKCEKAEKEVEKRSKDYDNALSSMPTGWSLLGMKVVEGLTSVVSETLSLYATRGLKSPNMKNQEQGPRTESHQAQCPTEHGIEGPSVEDLIVFNNMKHHSQLIQHSIKDLFDDDGYNRDAKGVRAALVMFNKAAEDLNANGVSASLKQQAPFYRDLLEIIKCVEDECLKGTADQASTQRTKLEAMLPKALELEALANASSSTTGLNKQTPFMSKAAQSNDDASTLAVKMAQTKMEMTSAQLNHCQDQYNMASENLAKVNAKLAETLRDISKLDSETATVREILDMLRKGLMLLSKLRDQWGQLTIFFEGMATLIKVNLYTRTDKFIKQADKLGQRKIATGMSPQKFSKDLIYSSAREATCVGFVVNKLASQYFSVSEEYLMPPMGRLSELMVLDKDQDRDRIIQLKGEIMAECDDAQAAIQNMVDSEKRKFNENIKKRIDAIENEFGAIVNNPAVTQDERKAIRMEAKRVVEAGRSDVSSANPPPPLFDADELEDW